MFLEHWSIKYQWLSYRDKAISACHRVSKAEIDGLSHVNLPTDIGIMKVRTLFFSVKTSAKLKSISALLDSKNEYVIPTSTESTSHFIFMLTLFWVKKLKMTHHCSVKLGSFKDMRDSSVSEFMGYRCLSLHPNQTYKQRRWSSSTTAVWKTLQKGWVLGWQYKWSLLGHLIRFHLVHYITVCNLIVFCICTSLSP